MNDNVLRGIRCPQCGADEPFYINATATFLVYDSGSDEFEDLAWDDESFIVCISCKHRGIVKEFYSKGA